MKYCPIIGKQASLELNQLSEILLERKRNKIDPKKVKRSHKRQKLIEILLNNSKIGQLRTEYSRITPSRITTNPYDIIIGKILSIRFIKIILGKKGIYQFYQNTLYRGRTKAADVFVRKRPMVKAADVNIFEYKAADNNTFLN